MSAETLLESYDEELESFDESYDELYDESLDAEIIGPAIAQGLRNTANFVGGMLGFPPPAVAPPPRPRLPQVPPLHVGNGVGTATLNTPNGSATLRLPAAVVRQEEFKQVTDRLQGAINRNTARLNTVQQDVTKLGQRVGVVVAETRRETARALDRVRKEQRAALAKLKKEQQQQNMTNLMMSMLTQQQITKQLETHTHPLPNEGGATLAPTSGGGSSSNMALAPLLLAMQPDGGSDSNTALLLAMVMFADRKS